MQLSPDNARDFIRLHASLLHYLYQQDPNTDPVVEGPAAFMRLPNEVRLDYHKWLSDEPEWIDEYVRINPDNFTRSELDDVRAWRYLRRNMFCVFRHLKKHTIFIEQDKTPALYGVVGIHQPIEKVLGTKRPLLIETTLMPFRGVITYDGFFRGVRVGLGSGYKASFTDLYRELKQTVGITTDLTESDRGEVPG